MNRLIFTGICTLLLLSQGCSNNPQQTMELGHAVAKMTELQTLNPDAKEQNGTEVHSNMDGQMGENILSTYRDHIDRPQDVKNEIQVNIGN
ncbi:MAG: hypothetical protein OIF55_15460 [Amphritea sp.]|nr:hypothetical protein [Amphritea sp.]